jgi:hypothetical protein
LYEKIQRVQRTPDRVPIPLEMVRLCFEEQLLKGAVEFADRFLLVDALVALQSFNDRVSSRRNRLGKSCLSPPRWALDDDGLLHARRKVDHLKRNRIDHVFRRFQTMPEIVDRCEHAFPLD